MDLEPLAKWCRADYVEKRVKKIVGSQNMIELEDGSKMEYDVLVVNVGSKTRGTEEVKGVYEHSLTTRPINELLPKIEKKEKELLESGIIPSVVVCGAGAAGTELSFGFKQRWSKLFKKDISVTLLSSTDTVLRGAHDSTIN